MNVDELRVSVTILLLTSVTVYGLTTSQANVFLRYLLSFTRTLLPTVMTGSRTRMRSLLSASIRFLARASLASAVAAPDFPLLLRFWNSYARMLGMPELFLKLVLLWLSGSSPCCVSRTFSSMTRPYHSLEATSRFTLLCRNPHFSAKALKWWDWKGDRLSVLYTSGAPNVPNRRVLVRTMSAETLCQGLSGILGGFNGSLACSVISSIPL